MAERTALKGRQAKRDGLLAAGQRLQVSNELLP
jgi:hypothetical protein